MIMTFQKVYDLDNCNLNPKIQRFIKRLIIVKMLLKNVASSIHKQSKERDFLAPNIAWIIGIGNKHKMYF